MKDCTNLKKLIYGFVIPGFIRNHIYWGRIYIGKFGFISGLISYYKIAFFKRELIGISIPQSKSRIHIRQNTSDLSVFSKIFIEEEYSLPISLTPRLIVDGGANCGYAAIYFANKYPEAKIISIEPEQSNVKMLRLNTSSYPNIRVIHGAIWDKKADLKLENPNAEKWSYRVKESESAGEVINVIAIEDILKMTDNRLIDILKLDVEGAEMELFSNCEGWLDKIKVIIIELHERYKPGCSNVFYDAVSKYKYDKFKKGENVILIRQDLGIIK